MAQFNYKAVDNLGKTVKGSISATNEIDLEGKLLELGLYIVDYKESKKEGLKFFNFIDQKEIILFCLQLEQMEKAGVPILEALEDVKESVESSKMKYVVSEIIESMKSGLMLSTALALHPQIFDKLFVGLVATGENTGQLQVIFGHLANHLKWLHDIKSKIKKASYYPMFLLLLMCGIISLMMLFVIPKLAGFLSSQNFELPLSTRLLISTSGAFQNYWYLIFSIPIFIVMLLKTLIKYSYDISYTWDQMKLNIPIIGTVIRKIEIARFCRFFAITFRSGIGILECLDISSNTVINKVIKESITSAREALSAGQSLSLALKVTKQFPRLVARMIKIGEDSGHLDTTLENVNFFYDKEVEDSVSKMLGSIQPTLTIILGFIMFWVTSAVFGPLYGSFSKLNI